MLNEVCFVRVGVKTYRMVDLQEQGGAALRQLLNEVCFVRVGVKAYRVLQSCSSC